MSAYSILLFVHLLGAIGTFAILAVEGVLLGKVLRAETSEEVRRALPSLGAPFRLGPVAMGALLASGAWMMALRWDRSAWLVTSFLGLVGMALLGGLVSLRQLRRARAAPASEDGAAFSEPFRTAQLLGTSLRLRVAIGIAVLALMTFKPDATASLLVLATGVLGGLVASLVPLANPRPRLVPSKG